MTFPYDIVTASEWGAREWGAMLPQGTPREVFVHHTASADAGRIETRRQQKAAMRAIERYHMDVNDWSAPGYHFVVFEPDARHRFASIFAGRPVSRVPAAQQGHNPRTLAIAVYGDGNAASMQRNTRFAIECLAREFAPEAECVGGHRDVWTTACPGSAFYRDIPTIARAVGLPTYAFKHR